MSRGHHSWNDGRPGTYYKPGAAPGGSESLRCPAPAAPKVTQTAQTDQADQPAPPIQSDQPAPAEQPVQPAQIDFFLGAAWARSLGVRPGTEQAWPRAFELDEVFVFVCGAKVATASGCVCKRGFMILVRFCIIIGVNRNWKQAVSSAGEEET